MKNESIMALTVMILPILLGKQEMCKKLMEQVTTEQELTEFLTSQNKAGVHERSSLQEGPNKDFVILTFEGQDPEVAWQKLWLLHQMDLSLQ